MKKVIIAAVFTVFAANASAYTINLNELSDFGNFMQEKYADSPNGLTCQISVTDENTGRVDKGRINTGKQYTKQGNNRIYHEEDATGSTTIEVNMKNGRAQVTIMDESSVVATGTGICG